MGESLSLAVVISACLSGVGSRPLVLAAGTTYRCDDSILAAQSPPKGPPSRHCHSGLPRLVGRGCAHGLRVSCRKAGPWRDGQLLGPKRGFHGSTAAQARAEAREAREAQLRTHVESVTADCLPWTSFWMLSVSGTIWLRT